MPTRGTHCGWWQDPCFCLCGVALGDTLFLHLDAVSHLRWALGTVRPLGRPSPWALTAQEGAASSQAVGGLSE